MKDKALSRPQLVDAQTHRYRPRDALMQFFQELKLCIERSYPDAGWRRIWRHNYT
jgi:hypothetical protein